MGQEEKYMDEYIKEISEKIEDKKEYYAKIPRHTSQNSIAAGNLE